MKKYFALSLFLILCTTIFSFTVKRGGDVFEVYLNGRQVHQQFIHADKSVKTLHLASSNDNDKIEVLYSHCGHAGKNRVITIRNEKNEPIKELKFPDAAGNRSMMAFYRKDISKNKSGIVKLYYSSRELSEGRLLATFRF